MDYFDIAEFLLQIFRDQATVTMLGRRFAAQQAGIVQLFRADELFYVSRSDQPAEAFFPLRRVDLLSLVGVEYLPGRRKIEDVAIVAVADLPQEKDQVIAFGKLPRKL